jgi:hypothetical protein
MTKTNQTAVAKKADAKPPVAAGAYDYGDLAGVGFEGMDSSDLSIPFISILHTTSPQVEEQSPEGCAGGDIFNTVTNEFGKEVFVLPVHQEKAFVEWVPRTKGGGFVSIHDPNSAEVKAALEKHGQAGKIPFGENELVETHYVYCLLLNEDGLSTNGFGVLSFTSTRIKQKKDWYTAMLTIKGKPPTMAQRAKFTTKKVKNEQGTWFNWVVEPMTGGTWAANLLNPSVEAERALINEAVEFRKMVLSGMAKADFSQERATAGSGEGKGNGEDVPF